MADKVPGPNAQQALEVVVSPSLVKFYSNAANIEVTPWDFKFIFGELKRSGNKPVVEQLVSITMSPQHAKALAGLLVNNLREYEKQIGQINLPQANENATPEAKVGDGVAARHGS